MAKFNNWFFCEVQDAASVRKWTPTRAQTMEGAKRAAKRAQVFQGTTLKVGMWSIDDIKTYATNSGQGWQKSRD